MPTDYYEVLGVPRTAPEGDIKRAYRQLARKYHPDVATDKTAAENHFKEINEAYEVLSDPQKRANYDRFGHAGEVFVRPSLCTAAHTSSGQCGGISRAEAACADNRSDLT